MFLVFYRVQNNQHIHVSPSAEPLKKKKKMDPAIVKAREEKKKRRIEKSIRRLEKNAKELKPLEELGIPLSLAKGQK